MTMAESTGTTARNRITDRSTMVKSTMGRNNMATRRLSEYIAINLHIVFLKGYYGVLGFWG